MKSKNILNYSQPDFYRFNTDSVELSKFVNQSLKGRGPLRVLDLCCGCGVIGVEFESLYQNLYNLTFLELQVEFEKHIIENSKNLSCDFEIIINDFNNFHCEEKFDLILSNPPYFELGSGRLSPDKNRNMCRHFDKDKLSKFIEKVFALLNIGGEAFVVHREDLSALDTRIKEVGHLKKAKLFRFFLDV